MSETSAYNILIQKWKTTKKIKFGFGKVNLDSIMEVFDGKDKFESQIMHGMLGTGFQASSHGA